MSPFSRPRALVLLALAAAGCGEEEATSTSGPNRDAPEITELSMVRVKDDLSKADPAAPFWNSVAAGAVTMIAQPMIAPRPELVNTERLVVQAAHNDAIAAFRLSWADSEMSAAGRLGEFSDAVAIQFPLMPGELPPVFMGAVGKPVHIFHWRAQYQQDAEQGKPEIQQLYPNASIDMYAMDFKDAPGGSRDEREMFNPAVALGNPQSTRKSGVDEIVAEGFSTSAVQASHESQGRGEWADGQWTVVITRPLSIEGGNALAAGGESALTFAVWQGGKGEVGSRKSLHFSWIPLKVAP